MSIQKGKYRSVDQGQNPKKIKKDPILDRIAVKISDKLTVWVKEGTNIKEIKRKYENK